MDRSSFLPDADDGTVAPHELCFALLPDRAIADDLWRRAESYRARHGLAGEPTPAGRLHISLVGVGSFPRLDRQVVAKALEAAGRVAARPFAVALNRLVSWKGRPRPLVLTGEDGVIGVQGLRDALYAVLAEAGLGLRRARAADRAFEPHLTLLRDATETPSQWIRPVGWQVRDFVLIDSRRGIGRHDILGHWALQA